MSPQHSPDPETRRHAAILREEIEIAHDFARVTTPAERRRAFGILFISLVCMGAGQTVLFNVLPPLSRQLGLSPVQTTSVFAVSAAVWVVTSTYWGRKSDQWGRKPVMLLGLLAFAASFALFAGVMLGGLRHWLPAFAVFPLMVVTRSLYGLLGSGTQPASQAYVADRTTPAERLQGVATIGSAFGLGTAVGPAIASLFAVIGLLAPFFFISVLALASAATIWFLLPERTPPKAREPVKSNLKWYDRRILPFVIFAIGLSTASTVPIQTMGFFFMDVLQVKPEAAAQFNMIGQMASSMAALFAQLVLIQRVHISARAFQGGHQPERNAGQQRRCEREQENRETEVQRPNPGQVGRRHRHQEPRPPTGKQQSGGASEYRNREALGEQLTDQPYPWGAQGRP